MEIKNKKNWMYKNYFFSSLAIFGILFIPQMMPIESGEEIMECIAIIFLSGLLIIFLGALTSKRVILHDNEIEIKTLFKSRMIPIDEIEEIQFELGKRAQSGMWGAQLRFYVNGKVYRFHSSEYDGLDKFVMNLEKKTSITWY